MSAVVRASASTVAVKSRRMTKFAPSPPPISSAMTRRTMSAYSSSAMSKPASCRSTGSSAARECVSSRERLVALDDEAAQRRVVVVALEAALDTWRNGTSASTSRGVPEASVKRDVGEPLDVDDLARQQLDGRVVARDQRERLRPRERRVQGGRARCHRRPFIGSGGRSNEKDRPRAVCGLGTRTHRRQRAGHHVVRFVNMRSR